MMLTPLGQSNRLYTKDIGAMHHILMNSTTIYQRSKISQTNINRVLGPGKLTFDAYPSTSTDTFDKGLLVAEGKLLTPVHEPRLDS